MNKNIRATLRATAFLAALPAILGLAVVQGFVVGPWRHNYTTIPNMVLKGMRKLLGLKIEFNPASAPLVKDKQVFFLANHQSFADILVLGGVLKGSFVSNGDILNLPVVGQIVRAGNTIGVRRRSKYNPESRGKIIKNLNDGYNAIMFPEASAYEGKFLRLFHAAYLEIFYDGKAMDKKKRDVTLKKDTVVQSIAIRVKSVNGQDAVGNDDVRSLYSMPGASILTHGWRALQLKETTVEVTALPPLNPADFGKGGDDEAIKLAARALANASALQVASVFGRGQTEFPKGVIQDPSFVRKKRPHADTASPH